MLIKFSCPVSGNVRTYDRKLGGAEFVCPECGQEHTLPKIEEDLIESDSKDQKENSNISLEIKDISGANSINKNASIEEARIDMETDASLDCSISLLDSKKKIEKQVIFLYILSCLSIVLLVGTFLILFQTHELKNEYVEFTAEKISIAKSFYKKKLYVESFNLTEQAKVLWEARPNIFSKSMKNEILKINKEYFKYKNYYEVAASYVKTTKSNSIHSIRKNIDLLKKLIDQISLMSDDGILLKNHLKEMLQKLQDFESQKILDGIQEGWENINTDLAENKFVGLSSKLAYIREKIKKLKSNNFEIEKNKMEMKLDLYFHENDLYKKSKLLYESVQENSEQQLDIIRRLRENQKKLIKTKSYYFKIDSFIKELKEKNFLFQAKVLGKQKKEKPSERQIGIKKFEDLITKIPDSMQKTKTSIIDIKKSWISHKPLVGLLNISERRLRNLGERVSQFIPNSRLDSRHHYNDFMFHIKSNKYEIKGGYWELPKDSKKNLKSEAVEGSSNIRWVVLEINQIRIMYPEELFDNLSDHKRESVHFYVQHALRLSEVLIKLDDSLTYSESGWRYTARMKPWPFFCAQVFDGNQYKMILNDNIFTINSYVGGHHVIDSYGKADSELLLKVTKSIEKELLKSNLMSKRVRETLETLLRSSYQELDSDYYLPSSFSKNIIANGYLERSIPNINVETQNLIKEYRDIYEEKILVFKKDISSINNKNESFSIFKNLNGETYCRIYDKVKDETIFIKRPLRIEMDSSRKDVGLRFGFSNVYKGKISSDDSIQNLLRIETIHPIYGKIASFDVSSKIFSFDENLWNKSCSVSSGSKGNGLFDGKEFEVPPHALFVDNKGQILKIITPKGELDFPSFSENDYKSKIKKMDNWIVQCAKVLSSPRELHLLFKYFFKYTYDSPSTQNLNIIGNKNNSGDYHQTSYQTLDRLLVDKLLCDCDDLAELYRDIVRAQGKNAYVMGVPGHATCCWVENRNGIYEIYFLDTGLPRKFSGKDFKKTLLKAFQSYDPSDFKSFNPNQITFLFRFDGEQTRESYLLGSKVFLDSVYAKVMIELQECWHYSYYFSGIEKVLNILKTEKSSVDYHEIASFSSVLHLKEKAVHWQQKAMSHISKENRREWLSSKLDLIGYLYTANRKKESLEACKEVLSVFQMMDKKDHDEIYKTSTYRLRLLSYLSSLKKFNLTLDLLKSSDIIFRRLKRQSIGRFIALYSTLRIRSKSKLSKSLSEKELFLLVEEKVKDYFKSKCFLYSDTKNRTLENYGLLFQFYIAKFGYEKAILKLNDSDLPENFERKHYRRDYVFIDEDWKWIRMSSSAHLTAVDYYLNKLSNSAEKQKRKEFEIKALALLDQQLKSYILLKNYNGYKQNDFEDVLFHFLKASVKKDWPSIESIFIDLKKKNWAGHFRKISREIARCSRYLNKEDYNKLVRLFFSKKPPKQYFLKVAYQTLYYSGKEKVFEILNLACAYRPLDKYLINERESFKKAFMLSKNPIKNESYLKPLEIKRLD